VETFSFLVVVWALFLNSHKFLVEMNTWFLIVVPPIPYNTCVLIAFLPSRMYLEQHGYLSFGCGALGC